MEFDTDRRKPRVEETTFLSRNKVKCHLCGVPGHKEFEGTQKRTSRDQANQTFRTTSRLFQV